MIKPPGKYDSFSERVQKETKADGVLLLVVGGNKGHGCSLTGNVMGHSALLTFLKKLVVEIEQDLETKIKEMKNGV